MSVMARADWGARPLDHRAAPMRAPAHRLIVHHSAGDASSFVAGMKGIEREHMDVKGWSGPAYNVAAGVGPGEQAELRGWGIKTIATLNANAGSWTICAVGNFEVAEPPAPLIENIASLAAEGIRRGHLVADFAISGHRDHGATDCPGRFLHQRLDALAIRIHELSGTPLPAPFADRPTLRPGDRGPAVAVLQRALRELGGATIIGPDRFGPATERAVRGWDRFFGLPDDGMADAATWRLLDFVAGLRGRVIR